MAKAKKRSSPKSCRVMKGVPRGKCCSKKQCNAFAKNKARFQKAAKVCRAEGIKPAGRGGNKKTFRSGIAWSKCIGNQFTKQIRKGG